MSIFARADELLPGLMPAAWRGVPFHAPNASHEVGRRILKTYFPGIDMPAFEDFGRHDGPIDLTGLIVGDDYVARAEALRAAFQAPGPGTLFHPWLGEIFAVTSRPAVISFDVRELRVARFRASFERVGPSAPAAFSTLAGLLWAAGGLTASGATLVASLLGGVNAAAIWSASREIAAPAAIRLGERVERAGATRLARALEPDIATLAAFPEPPGRVAAATLGAALTALPGRVALAVRPAIRPAIGPGPAAIRSEAIAGRSVAASAIGPGPAATAALPEIRAERAAALLLGHADEIGALPAFSATEAAIAVATKAASVAAALTAATEIAYESRQQAIAWRGRLDAGLAQTMEAASGLADAAADPAARMWNDAAHARAALGRDMHEVIGRLPAVRLHTPAATVSTWLIAQHFAGDDPASVVPLYDDIHRRNRLRHPGAVPPEPIEVLAGGRR